MTKTALGRGLGALLGGSMTPPKAAPAPVSPVPTAVPTAEETGRERIQYLALDRVHPSPSQPRKRFEEEPLQELAESIRSQGILQPLIVRSSGGNFELIAGERRWRAAQIAGLKEVPVLVRETDDRGVLEMALVENLQRENLNPVEEAQGYSLLIEQFQLTQEEAAGKVGKSRVLVANAVRLLKLPSEILSWLRDGRLSVGHAKVLLSLPTAAEQKLAAERVIKDNLTVRETEELAASMTGRPAGPSRSKKKVTVAGAGMAGLADIENRLREKFGTRVSVKYKKGRGAVEIQFFNDDDLGRILGVVGITLD